jgi:hypothetical protein
MNDNGEISFSVCFGVVEEQVSCVLSISQYMRSHGQLPTNYTQTTVAMHGRKVSTWFPGAVRTPEYISIIMTLHQPYKSNCTDSWSVDHIFGP